jgi:type IX secretion system PorP/SprF family membrane protein
MRKIIYIFLLLAGSLAKGQEQLPIYNQYLFGSYFLINPAVAGIDNVWKVQMTHRQQWVGMEDAPNTQSIAGEGQLYKNLKVGGYIFMDKNGYHRQNGFQFALSYTIKLDNERTSLRRLSLGLSYSGSQKYINQNDLEIINDPIFMVGEYNFYNNNASFGAFMMWDGFYAGLAGSHLLSGGYKNDNTHFQNTFFPRNYNALVGWKMKQSREFYIEPSVMLRVIENYDTHLDLNAKFYYVPTSTRRTNSGYWIGGSYRTSWKEFPINSLSFSAFVGGSYQDFYYGYSYEIMIDKYQAYHSGSHQFMIGYTLSLKADRKCGCTPFSIPVL